MLPLLLLLLLYILLQTQLHTLVLERTKIKNQGIKIRLINLSVRLCYHAAALSYFNFSGEVTFLLTRGAKVKEVHFPLCSMSLVTI